MQAPNEFYCPISQELMQDPVVAADGFSYQKKMIEKWLQKSNISPKTGAQLSNKITVPNGTLRVLINDYRSKHNIESSRILLDLDKVNKIVDSGLMARQQDNEQGNINQKIKNMQIIEQKDKEIQRLKNLLNQKEEKKINQNLKIERIQFTNGYYIGQLFNGRMNGKGKFAYIDGDTYEGDWRDGKKNGKGKLSYKNGDIYEGDWRDDKINGKGKLSYKNGDIYEGDWRDDNMHGKGKLAYKIGDIYQGDYKDGKMNGKGKLVYKNGDIYDGDYEDGKMNGKGKLSYKTGEIYEGEWKDGKMNGKGKFLHKNGKVQIGEWKNNFKV